MPERPTIRVTLGNAIAVISVIVVLLIGMTAGTWAVAYEVSALNANVKSVNNRMDRLARTMDSRITRLENTILESNEKIPPAGRENKETSR